ncbi:DUF1707 domain-containing protein [Rhodococcus sp. Z13]|uniref:DUF1707 domain-containing protein n=1 Tax=Rhodococcus sacchari TaxID=2962047 RepID=A0ACD4DF52_9NOCA|nr:DUF1707 domain-containing protein [Rhodococcus sp. Z13]UYP18616.1 DUF1707 domain-containing protein [Rhodococcus sp. Z13]
MTGNSDHDDLLLSDAERMHALNALGEHYAAGRLDSADFYERSGEIASARTFSALSPSFRGLPGGVPLELADGHIRMITESSAPAVRSATSPATAPSAEDELESLKSRGSLVETLDWIIIGITLVTFLVLQIAVDWDYAWIVWPSLIVTLSIPRLILKYSDDDEEVYEELKKSEAEARKKRLAEASERIRELENRRGPKAP